MKRKNFRAKTQAFGGFLTAMVIPNMPAFIAWGFITALFIPTGWFPNEGFNTMVTPMLTYLLPLLLAYTGGTLVYGQRGGVAGAIGTIGVIIGSDIAMFLGAMIMGPLTAWIIKKFDGLVKNKIPTGFEMVIDNFSLGIIGFFICLCSYSVIGPVITSLNTLVSTLVEEFVKTGFLPLLAVINEPARILFLNNVIDQGIYFPLGMQQALEVGKSIYFTVACNPGAGLGILLAYSFFGTGVSKKTAPGAIIIHFFGGIHEMYFPYVLMKPVLIIAAILGNAVGIAVFSLFDAGLAAAPSPASIFSFLMLTPKGNFLGILSGIFAAALVSFLIASVILKISKAPSDEDLEASQEKAKSMKQEGKDLLNSSLQKETSAERIANVAFACDAGMGSSAMGASAFRKKLQKQGIDITVQHYAIEKVPEEAQVIVIHENLADRAKISHPDQRIIKIKNYMSDPNIDAFLQEIIEQNQ